MQGTRYDDPGPYGGYRDDSDRELLSDSDPQGSEDELDEFDREEKPKKRRGRKALIAAAVLIALLIGTAIGFAVKGGGKEGESAAVESGDFAPVAAISSLTPDSGVSEDSAPDPTPAREPDNRPSQNSDEEGASSSTRPSGAVESGSEEDEPTSSSKKASKTADASATPKAGAKSKKDFVKKAIVYQGGEGGMNFAQITQIATDPAKQYLAYNWWHEAATPLPSNVRHLPCLCTPAWASTWSQAAAAAIETGATHLLGFNEPNQKGQAWILPNEAAPIWKEAMEPFKGRAKLVSPGVTYGEWTGPEDGVARRPKGINWLKEFQEACEGCTFDVWNAHWYGDPNWNEPTFASFKNHMENFHEAFSDAPIWVTEFGMAVPDAERIAFLEEAIPWMEQTEWIEAYFYFGVWEQFGLFQKADGSQSELGKAYRDLGS